MLVDERAGLAADVFGDRAGVACVVASVVRSAVEGLGDDPSCVYGIDGYSTAGEEVCGLAVFVVGLIDAGEWVAGGNAARSVTACRKDVEGERTGEPDEVLASGDIGEIAAKDAHRLEGVDGTLLEVEGVCVALEAFKIGN